MKLNISTEALRKALARLASVPGVLQTHLPTLTVIIEVDDFTARLRRTTGIASVSLTLDAGVEETGSVGVGYETLYNAVNALAGADTVLHSDGKDLHLQCGKTRAKLHAIPPEEFMPEPPIEGSADTMNVSSKDFLQWLAVTSPAAATAAAEAKFYGVCLRVQKDKTTLFAVDRRRCHLAYVGGKRAFINPAESGKTDNGVLILQDSVNALRKLLPEDDGRLDISLHKGALRATVADVDALLPLGAEQPPDMSSVMPFAQPSPNSAKCDRAELLRATRTAAPLGFQDSRVLSLKFNEGSVEIIADNRTGAMLGHEIDAEVKGGPVHLRTNGQWFADFLESAAGETIEIYYLHAQRMLYTYSEDRILMLTLIRDDVSSD
jgi:DNA polymerase III sliding clamp (beta) subunit (PCNA family)